jgi:hypothetical protein
MYKSKSFYGVGGGFRFPLVADELVTKCYAGIQPREERLPVFRALYQNPKLSSNSFVVFDPGGSTVDYALSLLEGFALAPATFADLLFFGSHLSKEVGGPIMAFGTKVHQPDGSYLIPKLDGGFDEQKRTLSIIEIQKVGHRGEPPEFGGGWAYLAFPKALARTTG